MALHLCLNSDGTGLVSPQNPIQTKHTNSGEPVTVPVYIYNDGKRSGVENDSNPPELLYANTQIKVEGVSYLLEREVSPSNSDVTLNFDSVSGWNIGTILQAGMERMRVEEVLNNKAVRVQRNYTADGKPSTLSSHNVGTRFTAEATTISLALPDVNNYNNPGTFLPGGEALVNGLDPTILALAVNNLETSNIIRSSDASKYANGSIIKIDKEEMKVLSTSGNDMTVLRGYNGSTRTAHSQNATIYLVGMVDKMVTHKIFIKNDPPGGLPTQKKADVKLVVISDEEPV